MDRSPRITIAIPTYDYSLGIEHLSQSFEMLKKQTFQDFEVVITDDSLNGNVREFVRFYDKVRYIKNMNQRGMAGNTNTAIQYANGEIIKILYQDDYLAHEHSLEDINNAFNEKVNWLVTACLDYKDESSNRLHFPTYNDAIHTGNNTIGSPSVLTIRNDKPLLFNPKLTWVLDCDYYKQLYKRYGAPAILNDVNVVIRIGEHQTTHILSSERKNAEIEYLIQKYDSGT